MFVNYSFLHNKSICAMIFSTKAIQRGLYKNELSIGNFLDNANTPCVCAHRHGVPKKPVPVGLYDCVYIAVFAHSFCSLYVESRRRRSRF